MFKQILPLKSEAIIPIRTTTINLTEEPDYHISSIIQCKNQLFGLSLYIYGNIIVQVKAGKKTFVKHT